MNIEQLRTSLLREINGVIQEDGHDEFNQNEVGSNIAALVEGTQSLSIDTMLQMIMHMLEGDYNIALAYKPEQRLWGLISAYRLTLK